MSAGRALLLSALLLPCGVTGVAAQRPQAAVVPEAITVGEVFHAAIRVDVPPGTVVVAPDSLQLPADLELAGRRELRTDTVAGTPRLTVLYPLTAWRPGRYDLPAVGLRVRSGGGESEVSVQLPSFTVRSVLPADTAGVEARPAKDVFGASRVWWPLLLGLLLAAVAAAALWYWWRRRSAPAEVVEPAAPVIPREAALAQLDALRREGLIERGEVRLFYIRLTETLRRFAATLERGWGADLTTAELALRMRAAGFADGVELIRVLGVADLVKFARAPAPEDAASADLAAARDWVERVEPPGAAAGSDGRRAA
jgi:hypothetical protein